MWKRLIALTLGVLLAGPAGAEVPKQVLAAVGDLVSGGAAITLIGGYAAGPEGAVASRDTLDAFPGKAILLHEGALSVTVAVLDGQAPGGGTYSELGRVAVGANGSAIFRADVLDGDTTFSAIYRVDPNGVGTRLVRVGDPAPGDGILTSVDLPAANDNGEVVFRGEDSNHRQNLYRIGPGGLQRIVGAGDGHPAIGLFNTFGGPEIADDGTVIFFSSAGNGKKALFVAAPGSPISAIATVGGPAPNGVFTSLDGPAIGADGGIAFRGNVKGDIRTTRGIFVLESGVVTRLAAEGEAAPGGASYLTISDPTVGEKGAVAFRATLTSGEAIISVLDTLEVVAAAGEGSGFAGTFCPDTLPAGQFCFGDPVFGSRGRLAFRAALDDVNVNEALFVATLETTVRRPAAIDVDCGAGQKIQDALRQVSEGGVIRVTGTCRENVAVSTAGRVTIQGQVSRRKRKKRRLPALVAADPSRPALDLLTTAGPTTVTDLSVLGGNPTIRVNGFGHVLQGLDLRRSGGVTVAGAGHTVSGLRMRRVSGPCLTIASSTSAVTRNSIRGCRGDGLVVAGDGSSVASNTVGRSKGRGIVVEGQTNSVVKNRTTRNRGSGLNVIGINNTLLGNRSSGGRKRGIVVAPCNLDAGKNRPRPRIPACPTALATGRPVS
jgi:Right handed beta helix region